MTPPMTIEQVRERLGLKPFQEYAHEQMERWKADENRKRAYGYEGFQQFLKERRATGRSTETMCRALAYASEGRGVLYISTYEGHGIQLQDWARELALDPALVQWSRSSTHRPGFIPLYDHAFHHRRGMI